MTGLSIDWGDDKPGGMIAKAYCSAPHPDHPMAVWCRRQPGHPGDHAAYVFSISRPEYWPNQPAEEVPW